MLSSAVACITAAQNPYLPLWEYIPDGEPYLFEDPDNPGKMRVYVYGSHDSLIKEYCGREQVVWSAPEDDLTAWRYDGVIFESKKDAEGNWLYDNHQGDILYAPDMTVRVENGKKVYYLYPNNQAWGRKSMVAKSDRPYVSCHNGFGKAWYRDSYRYGVLKESGRCVPFLRGFVYP